MFSEPLSFRPEARRAGVEESLPVNPMFRDEGIVQESLPVNPVLGLVTVWYRVRRYE